MKLGYVGVGKMGGPMAERLLAAGNELVVFDTRAAAVDSFVARGARAAASVAALAREVDTVLVCLPSPDAVRNVAHEVAEAGTKVRTFVDLSTTGPRVEAEVAAALKAKGITACDSPVSGGVAGAQKGTLAVMLACPQELRAKMESLLAPLGKVFYLGERPGLGQTMKLANNLLSAAAMAITCEAVVMGVKGGLDARQMIDIINAGSGRNTATDGKFPRSILPRTFDYGFTNGHMYKDVKLCLEVAEEVGVPMWVGAAVRQLWAYSANHKGPDADFTTVIQCIEEWAGIEIQRS
ncbi:MAG TPA: NAD(P)-dependent oxidoreductase [Burkholderiales bacterium]|nr:NAD(P)-dependent oxidoreductase [Burkholderiales bacterium]